MCCSFFFVVVEYKVRVVYNWFEFIFSVDVEGEIGSFFSEFVCLLVLIDGNSEQSEYNYVCEVNVIYNYNVKLVEQSKFCKVFSSFIISVSSFFQMFNGLDDRE